MSNYNSIIQQNNAELEDILDTINALPEGSGGGSGGGVETCTVTLIDASENTLSRQGYYIGLEVEPNSGRSIAVENSAEVLLEGRSMVKNSLLVLYEAHNFTFGLVDIYALLSSPSSYLVGAEMATYNSDLMQNLALLAFHLTGDEVIINLPWL